MTVKEFLCKHFQRNLEDKNGNVINKPDGTPYKTGKVQFGSVIIIPILSYIFISVMGVFVVNFCFNGSCIPDYGFMRIIYGLPYWLSYFTFGILAVVGCLIVLTLFVLVVAILHTIWTWEIASCPNVEVPPKEVLEKAGKVYKDFKIMDITIKKDD